MESMGAPLQCSDHVKDSRNISGRRSASHSLSYRINQPLELLERFARTVYPGSVSDWSGSEHEGPIRLDREAGELEAGLNRRDAFNCANNAA